ncbi:tripartite tricarboxylate transporter substrate-binding protein [Bradyrhizobium sp. LHD-71]|uniref:Bug family tripartite tricarboxylate transporter substrate binding protein n=1 Tax=Bradyrhizobium sp. LHD-71 TaxID=3072141 RepID=UPI00280D5397|nr:tripartite tricarboxylate transporter substrate-binding protein [Bradyrhizobium sp. LHD-71]MDQ8729252.1 tripartite tricarboxylate transporter substrate-binding protein [Bradyrhizobium sp. LHD-71]
MTFTRRRAVLCAFAGLAIAATSARAEINGLEIIAPANPGSGFDQTSRAVQEALLQNGLAKGIQVVNVPGAGGTVGLAQFVSSKKPGASLLMIGVTTVGAILTNKAPVSLDDAFPLALLLREYSVVVVPAKSDVMSVADLAAKVKANPATVRWGVGSAGGIDHVIAGQFTKAVGADPGKLNGIHYPGGGEQLASILGGHVTVGVGGVPELASQIKSGKLRALAVSSPERLAGLDVPTLKEQGVDVAIGTWRGLMASKHATDAEKKELSAAIEKMVATPTWKSTLEKYGWLDAYRSSEGFAAFLKEQQAMMKGALQDVGLLKQ